MSASRRGKRGHRRLEGKGGEPQKGINLGGRGKGGGEKVKGREGKRRAAGDGWSYCTGESLVSFGKKEKRRKRSKKKKCARSRGGRRTWRINISL